MRAVLHPAPQRFQAAARRMAAAAGRPAAPGPHPRVATTIASARRLLVLGHMGFVIIAWLVGCPPVTGFVDRLEGPRAVLLTPEREVDIPRRCLPRGAREGAFLVRGAVDGRSFRLEIQRVRQLQETAARPRWPPSRFP